MPEICRKNRSFGIFSRFHNLFFWFFAQRCILGMFKTWLSPIFGENFFPAENAGNCHFTDFHRTFSLYFVVFSHKNINNNAHHMHGSFVNKTDFCSRNFLKVAGTADFCRKNGNSWISRAELYIFSWNLAHWSKMVISKIWQSPIFEKYIFRPKFPEICRKNRIFGIFLRFYHLFYLVLCAKMRIKNAQNMTESDFRENFFLRPKMAEISQISIFAFICLTLIIR